MNHKKREFTWEQPEEPQPEWRHADVGGNFERLDEGSERDGVLWRFFYSRDPKRRTITGRKVK